MRIRDLQCRMYSAKYERPISNGKYTYYATNIVVLQIFTDEGVTGVGWVHGGSIVKNAIEEMRDYIIGEDPFNVERVWHKLYLPKIFGRKGLTTRAISCIDIALWDIVGKATGTPVYKLLGGYRDQVPVYVAGGYYEEGKDLEALADEVKQNLAIGAKAIKMKVGRTSIREDIKRVERVREAIGPNVKLLVDANNAYRVDEAKKMARLLADYDVYWFEEPVSPDDLEGSAEVTRMSEVPIAAGENEYTRWGFRELAKYRAASIFNADAQVLGGVTEFRKVADLAAAHDIPIAPHGDQEIHVHLVAAFSNGLIVEFYEQNTNNLRSLMFQESSLRLKNGFVSPPSKPGWGVEINFDAISQYEVN
jgi:L-alanine-DL-glutamate epimerase-like enolase superfamily enzyme